MKSELAWRFKKVCKKLLTCQILCLVGVCMAATYSKPQATPNECEIELLSIKTVSFFSKSSSLEHPNKLFLFHSEGKDLVEMNQRNPMYIALDQYTQQQIPELLTRGLNFDILTIGQPKDTKTDRVVLTKVLAALSTIWADTLEFVGIDVDELRPKPYIANPGQRTLAGVREETRDCSGSLSNQKLPKPSPPSTYTCVAHIKNLKFSSVGQLSIAWLQKHLDMSQSQITLILVDAIEIDGLEVLDGFKIGAIVKLWIGDFLRCDSLDCRLLRDGPLPQELVITGLYTVTPHLPKEVARRIIKHRWSVLTMPSHIWELLMSPIELTSCIYVDKLAINMVYFDGLSTFCSTSLPVIRHNMGQANLLTINFQAEDDTLTEDNLCYILDWVCKQFIDLTDLQIGSSTALAHIPSCVTNKLFILETLPSLTTIMVGDKEAEIFQDVSKRLLCLSLDAWESLLTRRPNVWLDLGFNSGSHVSLLSSSEQEMLACHTWVGTPGEILCGECYTQLHRFKETRPSVQICFLEHPKQRICSDCLIRLFNSGELSRKLPSFKLSKKVLPLKNIIESDHRGGFYLKLPVTTPPRPLLSFPTKPKGFILTKYKK
ncbi:hypothetical protein NEDG_01575 [Nematocida displodere]|uniref:Uncharacterized protein n=1 Tax=Nematocida displodere TaxID=1805483 RepID=A0A177EJ58_9MICR|nr:hypothetical protein NEDG_01575 [Nematocida displodere]